MAYFLTFLTYGTHLPGDERRTVDRHLGRFWGSGAGAREVRRPNHAHMKDRARISPGSNDRRLVLESIVVLCPRREWRLIMVNILRSRTSTTFPM